MLRSVVDTSVLVSACLSRGGVPAEVLRRGLDEDLDIVASPTLLGELEAVLSRPRFSDRISPTQRAAFLKVVRSGVVLIDDGPPRPGATRDPADDFVVSLAVAADADAIVSSDKDLIAIDGDPIPVATPRGILDILDCVEHLLPGDPAFV